MKGGYQILDFQGIDLDAGTMQNEVPGAYETLEGNYRKPVLLHDFVVGGVEYVDTFVMVSIVASSFVFNVHGFNVVVADNDAVQVTAETEVNA